MNRPNIVIAMTSTPWYMADLTEFIVARSDDSILLFNMLLTNGERYPRTRFWHNTSPIDHFETNVPMAIIGIVSIPIENTIPLPPLSHPAILFAWKLVKNAVIFRMANTSPKYLMSNPTISKYGLYVKNQSFEDTPISVAKDIIQSTCFIENAFFIFSYIWLNILNFLPELLIISVSTNQNVLINPTNTSIVSMTRGILIFISDRNPDTRHNAAVSRKVKPVDLPSALLYFVSSSISDFVFCLMLSYNKAVSAFAISEDPIAHKALPIHRSMCSRDNEKQTNSAVSIKQPTLIVLTLPHLSARTPVGICNITASITQQASQKYTSDRGIPQYLVIKITSTGPLIVELVRSLYK